jgi:uncharacterized protein YjbI with pentapeptide repeats
VGQRKPEREQAGETKQSRWGFRGMTVRDWLQLLVVPLALVLIGFYFTSAQDTLQQQIDEDQRAQQAQIEEQRAAAELELAEQRAQDEALQAYLDQMSQLMLDRKLLEAEQGDPVHTLAQARTSTAILRLDAEHNESVTRFLSDSGLAGSDGSTDGLLRRIALSRATLSSAFLPNADLVDADLSGADLSNALLFEADLLVADLSGADFSNASLLRADLSGADLSGADLSGANLSGANLSGANAFEANLSGAFLNGANLSGADLHEADLSSADLKNASGVTQKELEQQDAILGGATMPDGQKYEE